MLPLDRAVADRSNFGVETVRHGWMRDRASANERVATKGDPSSSAEDWGSVVIIGEPGSCAMAGGAVPDRDLPDGVGGFDHAGRWSTRGECHSRGIGDERSILSGDPGERGGLAVPGRLSKVVITIRADDSGGPGEGGRSRRATGAGEGERDGFISELWLNCRGARALRSSLPGVTGSVEYGGRVVDDRVRLEDDRAGREKKSSGSGLTDGESIHGPVGGLSSSSTSWTARRRDPER